MNFHFFPPLAMSHLLLLCITLIILFPFSTLSQNPGNITVGSTIVASLNSKPWLSPSGDFAFGFQKLKDNQSFFVLSIWYAKIPNITIAWFERCSNPVPYGSNLTLEPANGLMLRDPQGKILFNTTGCDRVSHGFMNDNGNFVLSCSNSTSFWESFKNPADTILPNQTLQIDGTLISRKTETDFSYGRFYATLSDGNFMLNTKTIFSNLDYDDDYYNSQTKSGDQVVLDENDTSASVSVVSRNGIKQNILSSNYPPPDYYFRATLNFDGVFALYRYPKKPGDNSQWVSDGAPLPNNICKTIDGQKGSGACGFNSYCTLDNSSRPICQCPKGFELVDPKNRYGDCTSNFSANCVYQGADEYVLEEIKDVDWPFNDYMQMNKSTFDECRTACLSDCFCGAAIFRSDSCWKKRLPLSNGRVDFDLKATAFLKVRKTSS